MRIRRVSVEGGFLDRLDVMFEAGLNVVIGARGTGKTSLIELIRFALQAGHMTESSRTKADAYASSVLRDGRVTIEAELGGESVTFSRAGGEPRTTVTPGLSIVVPTILGQNEIEAVATDARGRVNLIDGASMWEEPESPEEAALAASVKSLSVEMLGLSRELDSLEEQSRLLVGVREELEEAQASRMGLLSKAQGAEAEKARLAELEPVGAILAVREQYLDRLSESVRGFIVQLGGLLPNVPNLEPWPPGGGSDVVSELEPSLEAIKSDLDSAHQRLVGIQQVVGELAETNRVSKVGVQDEARGLRKTLEELTEGVGEASRVVATLQERLGQLEAIRGVVETRQSRVVDLGVRRGEVLDELDQVRISRSEGRLSTCADLNVALGPRIRVALEKGGQRDSYESAIGAALRGSGLHYNQLAKEIATRTSPREFAEACETRDAKELADLTDLGAERSRRVVDQVAQFGTADILAAPIRDSVRLELLDGRDYKDSDELSTGQRCTVVLPILLARHRALVIDQPEDNLDNAFIVETLVTAIRRHIASMGPDSQLIFATHNANIPVLGEASKVVHLHSDGHRGFVYAQGPLESSEIVSSITTVMEGGIEAFERRARFYSSHSRNVDE